MDVQFDVIVVGTGPAGLAAALGLARIGRRVALVGPEPSAGDRRTTALMIPALDFLETLGVRRAALESAAPLKAMRIVDGTSRLLRSQPVTFHAHEIGEEAFGYNIPNASLTAALDDVASAEPGIARQPTTVTGWNPAEDGVSVDLADGTRIRARLAIGADGRESSAREAADIPVHRRELPQAALVLTFGHSRDHHHISTEFHTETGPFTIVPLRGQRSSLVWVIEPAIAETFRGLSDVDLAGRIEERMQSLLGKVELEPGRQVYPLSILVARRFAARRVALVGEAAHVFPPIGAQGLNLGLRDVADLLKVVGEAGEDPGADPVLRRYDRLRRPDVTARATAVNLLNFSLLSDLLPAQAARTAGLGALASFRPLRTFFMREGMQPGSGIARAFSSFGEKIRRQQA